MKYDTLVLNRSYFAVQICDSRKAMSLLFQNKSHTIDEDFCVYDWKMWLEFSTLPKVLDNGYHFMNTITHKIAIPDTIILVDLDRLPRRDVKYSRENILQRDKFTCQYCGIHYKRDKLTLDHVVPKSHGGNNSWSNVVCSCQECNFRKANRTPKQAGMNLLHVPKEPKWFDPLHKIASFNEIRPTWKKFLN